MSDFDKTILVSNIETLRNERGLSQTEFADAINMSQPNYCRAINLANSQCFTTAQIYKIAETYNVSIDSLFGFKKRHTDQDICSLFTSLIEQRKLVKIDFSREEDIYTPYYIDDYPDCHHEKKLISYPAFFFPNYVDIGPQDAYSEEELDNLRDEVLCCGNDDKSNQRINSFLDKFLSLYEIHLLKKIPNDAYKKVIDQFLDELG